MSSTSVSIAESLASHDTDAHAMKRNLGLFDTTLMVMGSLIGSGIFIVSAEVSRIVGSPGFLLLAWVVTGLLMIGIALSYGELAAMMPKVGGQYVFLKEAYGPLVGFLYGWACFIVMEAGSIAAIEMAFAKFTAPFFPFFSESNVLLRIGSFSVAAPQLLAIGGIVALTLINLRGIHEGKMIQNFLTIIKTLSLVGLIGVAFFVGYNHDVVLGNLSKFWDATWTHIVNGKVVAQEPLYGMGCVIALTTAIVGTFFALDGWNIVAGIAGEIKEPKKTLPLSFILGVGSIVLLYCLANVAYLCVLPLDGTSDAADVVGRGIQFAQDDRVGEAVVVQIFGPLGGRLISFLIMISCFGCSNGLILASVRIYYAMAKDGLFFRSMGKLNSRGVPGTALVWQCIWASVLCLSGGYNQLLDYSILAFVGFYILSVGAVFVFRWKRPDADRPYRVIAYPLLPALCICALVALFVDLVIFKPESTWPSIVLVLLGLPAYHLTKKKIAY